MAQTLVESKKAKIVGVGIAAVSALVVSSQLAPDVAAYCIAAMVIGYEIGQAIVDAFGKKKK